MANLASVAIEKAHSARDRVVARGGAEGDRTGPEGPARASCHRRFPEVVGYEFYSHYSPAQTVGGDYYDFVMLPGGRVAVVLGDVAGKGVPAALLVAKLSSEVRPAL